jgi:hypothetical protein
MKLNGAFSDPDWVQIQANQQIRIKADQNSLRKKGKMKKNLMFVEFSVRLEALMSLVGVRAKKIVFASKNLGLDTDPDSATAWNQIRTNKMTGSGS